MNLVADEGVDQAVVERLRRDGHEVLYVAELSPSAADDEVLQSANVRGAVLLTADKDFGELVFRQGLVHSGVILLRLAGLTNATKPEIVAEVCRNRHVELVGRSASCRRDKSVSGESHDDARRSNFGRATARLATPAGFELNST